jgi:hypothetical protein
METAVYPTKVIPREDTRSACGDADNGFGLLFNWNILGDGQHTVKVFDGGVQFGSAIITVATFGTEFLVGQSGTLTGTFAGRQVTAQWSESARNFIVTTAGQPPLTGDVMAGLYIGKTSQSGSCATVLDDDIVGCPTRLFIGPDATGAPALIPNSLVDFLTTSSCTGGSGEQIAFLTMVRCNQARIVIYRQCTALTLMNGSFSFVGDEDSDVTLSGSCSGTVCQGTISARSNLDPLCTHSAVTWSADLAQ